MRLRRPILTRRRVLVVALWVVGLLLAGLLTLRYVAAPWAIRRALASAGLQPVSFQIESGGLTGLRGAKVSVGTAPWLTVGAVEVAYSPVSLLAGRVGTITLSDAVWTVQVRGRSIDWGPARKNAAGTPTLNLPLDRLEVKASVIRLVVDGRRYDLPMTLTLNSSALEGVQGRLHLLALGAAIEVRAHATVDAGVLTLALNTSKPVAFNLNSGGISGALDSASARLRIGGDDVLEGSVALRGGSLQAGDAVLSELDAAIAIRSRHEAEVTELRATIGDGGTLTAAPFVLAASASQLQTRISLTNLSLAEWLPILSSHHATGEGRLSGTVDLAIDLATAKPVHLSGNLVANPSHGFIQVMDAESLGALLDAQDPRFATDEVMRPVRDKIVAAFRDFAFHTLTVDLSRREGHTIARAQISGFGRHGEDPQGLNLTLDLHVHDALIDLASRLAAVARMNSSAGGALDRFFGTTTPGDRPP